MIRRVFGPRGIIHDDIGSRGRLPIEGRARGFHLKIAVEEEAGDLQFLGRQELQPDIIGKLIELVLKEKPLIGIEFFLGWGRWRVSQANEQVEWSACVGDIGAELAEELRPPPWIRGKKLFYLLRGALILRHARQNQRHIAYCTP